MKNISTNINGYIEGYYGKLLKWSERYLILKKLHETGLNSYFYCPKEDINHRFNWRKKYPKKWYSSFLNFCLIAKKYKINTLAGISPGLDYNFSDDDFDFDKLLTKSRQLKDSGADTIVLMFDDIPEKFEKLKIDDYSEGYHHANLANRLSNKLGEKIFVVPRIYSDELTSHENTYLTDFSDILNKDLPIFYCGKKIVSETTNENEFSAIKEKTLNKIIIWDNLYANDYCPQKIFLGPWFGRKNIKNVMTNLTGLIHTDLILLDLISLTSKNKNNLNNWNIILDKYKIPKEFIIINKYFYPINYMKNTLNQKKNFNQEIESVDFLLWKWKTPLAREWYQYLFILKQDLNLLHNNLEKERIKKNFSVPLNEFINKKLGET